MQKIKNEIKNEFLYELMDTHGIPLTIISDMLHKHNMFIDVFSFFEYCVLIKKRTIKSIKAMLIESIVDNIRLSKKEKNECKFIIEIMAGRINIPSCLISKTTPV